jgi:hypothetical protein
MIGRPSRKISGAISLPLSRAEVIVAADFPGIGREERALSGM